MIMLEYHFLLLGENACCVDTTEDGLAKKMQ